LVFPLLRDTWRKNGPEAISALTRGLPEFVMSRAPGELSGIPVFCYHAISRTAFESHLQFLQANQYSTLSADEFRSALGRAERKAGQASGSRRLVVLTFDDGLLNLYDTVFPLLRRYGIRVVAFIAPAFHASSAPDGPDRSASRSLPTCSWREIEEMHASGMVDFQSHTFEHRLVPCWPRGAPLSGTSDSACDRLRGHALSIADDLARARDLIESRLGKRVRHLAFPLYNGTADAVRIGRTCGYEAFYWGVRPWKPITAPGDDFSCIVRLSGEFLPRLPGRGRVPLRAILRERYTAHAPRWWRDLRAGTR
jgi:peptidoglycan/xylan/chitin deacetylase (PgdA/CDA1 family)